jgi:formate hydrogenlyase transcriptional activator
MRPLRFPDVDLDAQQFAAVQAVADVVCLRHDPGELLGGIAPPLRSVLSFDLLTFALCDPTQKIMKLNLWEGSPTLRGPLELPLEESVAGSVWRNQTPTFINNLTAEKRFEPETKWLREREMHSYCVLPLTNFREKIGALGFGSKQHQAFHEPNVNFLHRVTELVALGIDSALTDAIRADELRRPRLLLEVGGPHVGQRNVRQSVVAILTSIQKWAENDYVGLYLYDETAQSLRLHMTDLEVAEKMAPEGVTAIEGTLAGKAFREHRSMVLDHLSLAALPFASVKRGMELGVKSLYLSPVLSPKGPLGVLKVARREDRGFSPRDVELLEQVVATVALALERTRTDDRNTIARPLHPGAASGSDTKNQLFAPAAVTAHVNRLQDILTTAVQKPLSVSGPGSLVATEALMDSEQLLTAYFRASGVGLCILDSEFRYLVINETLAKMNGVTAAAHLGKSVRDILGDSAELCEPLFRSIMATGQAITDFEISFVLPTRDEPGHWIEHYIPIKDESGRVAQIGIIAIEVTEQKKLEESLRGISETLRREKKKQHVLMEVSRLLAAKRDVRQIFPRISAYLRRVLRQEYAALSLREEKTGQLVPQAVDFPFARSLSTGGEIGTANAAWGRALRERSAKIFSRDEIQEFDPEIAAGLTSEGLKSLCCVPLFRPKGPLGVLMLGSTRADAFHNDDLTLLNQVAAQLAIALENSRTAQEVERLKHRLQQEKTYLKGEPRTRVSFEEIIGESPALQQVLDHVAVISASDATVLILGETGTGKGLIARAIHRTSKRKGRSFVSLNCAAIPTGLLESELFGHEKGAFTGAVNQKIGRLELADNGTLFLDEIGEIPLELQPKLLRVLQDHEFERLGGMRTIKVDLRLIAATNRDLAKSVSEREFRSDLFYRLNVFPIRIPSVRERREDIPLLVRYFVRKFSRIMNRDIQTIPNETMDALMQWHWPGNVRELENFIERSVIFSDGTVLRAPLAEFHAETSYAAEPSLEATEREVIIRVLRETGGLISGPTGAAHRLGMKRTTLQSKMQRLGITREHYSARKTN